MNILIIPEDFRKDQYILKGIIYKVAEEIFCFEPVFSRISPTYICPKIPT